MSLAAKVQSFDENRARIAIDWLAKNLTIPPFVGTGDLLADIKGDFERHVHVLTKEPFTCKAVEFFAFDWIRTVQGGFPVDDPFLVFNASVLLHMLQLGYESGGAAKQTLALIQVAHDATLRSYLTLSSAQVDAFCTYLLNVRDFLRSMSLGNTRIVLVDMPVGNTLAVCLLHRLLQPFCKVEIMRVALQRNTSRAKGPTRKELLAEKLNALGLKNNDVVLYFDEWSTGSNFYAMCDIQRKVIPTGAFFLPIAVLTNKSKEFERYSQFCNRHDELVNKWGQRGENFRKVLPPIPSASRNEGYFFWAEKDRMAGVRKMQVHGAIFSSLDATIKFLYSNQSELKIALGFQLGDWLEAGLVPEKYAKNLHPLIELFNEGYADYQTCREQLRDCDNDIVDENRGETIFANLENLSPKYAALLDKRKAKICVITALVYNHRFGSIDPADRYYFETHAPVIDTLTGTMSRVHEVAMQFLLDKIK